MSDLNVLPPVAKSFYTFCKKCDCDRYHMVLAHTTATSAKIECEVCHSKKAYSIAKAKKAASLSGGTGAPRASGARAAASANQRKSSHQAEYQKLMDSVAQSAANDYNVRSKFVVSSKLQHPKFGLGFIKSVQPDKIEVIFSDEVKMLIHNKV